MAITQTVERPVLEGIAKEKSDRKGWMLFLTRSLLFVALLMIVDFGIAGILTFGLKKYFGMIGHVPVLCVGHSRMVLGLDADMLSKELGLSVAKYGLNGANIEDRFAMVRHFLTSHPEVQVLVYDVESTSFSQSKLSSNSYRLFFPFLDNPAARDHVRSNCVDPFDYWTRTLFRSSRYNEVTLSMAVRGLLRMDENLKVGSLNPEWERHRIARGDRRDVFVNEESYRIFLQTLAWAQSRGVQILLPHMPTADVLNDHQREARQEVRGLFEKLDKENPDITYLDMSLAYESQHDLFYDAIHLNAKGQAVVTERVATELKNILDSN
jgi:hypothetical protein